MTKIISGYHFTGDKLRNRDPIPHIGEWLEWNGRVVPCESGLHMSEHPFDALCYAPGPLLHRVELCGELIPHGTPIDKWVGRRRRILASFDATVMLRRFACDQALSVISLWDAPSVVSTYLRAPCEEHRLTAQAAAWNAAQAAAQAAAQDAVWAAAWNAARAAARAAAWNAAQAAAQAAARAAARAAVWAAAWNAAWNAARAAARAEFAKRVAALFTSEAV